MLNLTDLTTYYINITFVEGKRETVFTSFSILENFTVPDYETKYSDLIQRDVTLSTEDKSDRFIMLLERDIKAILDDHLINLSTDINIDLNELNELAQFLYIIQNLDDYSYLSYRLNAQDTPRRILVDLIEHYSLLSKPRLLELIDSVEESFINSLKEYVKVNDTTSAIDKPHLKHVQHFFNFIDKHNCLGLKFFEEGYTNVTLQELLNLIDIDVPTYIDNLIQTDAPQAALDVLSLIIISKDAYEIPLLKFKQSNSYFTSSLINVTKINNIMLDLLNDFNIYLEVQKQQTREDNIHGN